MDENEMDDAELFGLGGPYPDENSEDTSDAVDTGALPFGAQEIQSRYGQLLKKYESSNQEFLNQLTRARNRLLSQPTEKSKSEYLRGLASALMTPPDRSDPRFYERKNLFTFLRDVGAYGSAEEEAAKKAKLKQEEDIAKLDKLRVKYEQQAAAQQLRELGPLYRETIKQKKEDKPPANVQEVQYYEAILADPKAPPEKKKIAQAMLDKLVRVPSESVNKPSWNERVVQAKLRKRQGKATQEDEVIIEMSEKAGGDFLSILRILSGNQE
jgi:hypothetical protein